MHRAPSPILRPGPRLRPARAILGLALVAALAAPLLASPADTVKSRISAYRELGTAFKGVNDGLRGEPQTVILQQYARQIRNFAKMQYTLFPADSGPQPGVKTLALPAIWAKPAQFKAAQDAFTNQAAAFQKAVSGGNAAAIRAEARKLGGSCKGCHDQFRQPKD